MESSPSTLAYLIALGVILRAAAALAAHGLRRPCRRAALTRDGRVAAR